MFFAARLRLSGMLPAVRHVLHLRIDLLQVATSDIATLMHAALDGDVRAGNVALGTPPQTLGDEPGTTYKDHACEYAENS